MIVVTRLNGSRFAVNADLIERIQENPDTTLVMVGGATYVVRESLADVIALIAEFRALVLAGARRRTAGEGPQLSVLRGDADDVEGGSGAATRLRPTER
ncbi:MAG TPA: flagellar FlbD family protein [Intrasporangium sp.]|nr:flagellar FlbD family protein [Intrasporangium sp.]